MVAADEHHLRTRVLGAQTCQEAVELLPGRWQRLAVSNRSPATSRASIARVLIVSANGGRGRRRVLKAAVVAMGVDGQDASRRYAGFS